MEKLLLLIDSEKGWINQLSFVHVWRVYIFGNVAWKKISRVFNFAKSTKIRKIRKNMYTWKLERLR